MRQTNEIIRHIARIFDVPTELICSKSKKGNCSNARVVIVNILKDVYEYDFKMIAYILSQSYENVRKMYHKIDDLKKSDSKFKELCEEVYKIF